MPHLDPFGFGPNTPEPPEQPPDEPVAEPEREQEIMLARDVPASEQQSASDDLDASGLDPALRLQDAVGTWGEGADTTPEEVGEAQIGDASEPEPEPFVPLTESGGQGI